MNKPVILSAGGPSILACGAWLKNTVCVTRGNEAYVSQLVGDLDSAEARRGLDDVAARLCRALGVRPAAVAHDLHPDFYSTQFAQAYAADIGVPVVAVQHHHAHIAAICAEHCIGEPVLGLALDGVGLGTDSLPWGGELLLVAGASFKRIGHLAPLPMPGGDRAAQEPWRMAAAALFQLGRSGEIARRFPHQPAARMAEGMLQRGLHCPATSSMGRLFDAAAGLLGVNEKQSFEAQAAIRLQALAERNGKVPPLAAGHRIMENSRAAQFAVLDFLPLLAALADCPDPAYGAALFHATVTSGLAEWVRHAAAVHNVRTIALGGGCFHNDILSRTLSDQLADQGLRVLTAREVPPNDSAISLGQAWVALKSITEGG